MLQVKIGDFSREGVRRLFQHIEWVSLVEPPPREVSIVGQCALKVANLDRVGFFRQTRFPLTVRQPHDATQTRYSGIIGPTEDKGRFASAVLTD